ncbi:MAG TPA: TPM domain-containing protein [Xanthobacteraceae bacterium]|nr:TPM domain-containing protein [Xanthobacteraceae bacterium]
MGLCHAARIALATTIVVAALASPGLAQTFPQLTGRVVDEAGVLDAPVRASIETDLADLEAKTTDQLVVVTVRSLQGHTIEDYGVRLGRQWQIGRKDKNNGALLIVAPQERKVRIEVGYGLEGVLTDAATKLIIENTIIPRFRANDISGGVTRGVDEIIRLLDGDAATSQGHPAPPRPARFTRVMHGVGGILSYMPGDMIVIVGLFVLACGCSLVTMLWLWLLLPLGLHIGIWLGMSTWQDRLRQLLERRAKFQFFSWLNYAPSASSHSHWSSGSSSSSWSGGFFSGGGGSFGGGGSSGSW